MPGQLMTVLSVVVGVAAVSAAMVAPLYILVLRVLRDVGQGDNERQTLHEAQQEIGENVEEVKTDMRELRQAVEMNSMRHEQTAAHLHDLLVGERDPGEYDNGNLPHGPDNCPYPDTCPWHEPADG